MSALLTHDLRSEAKSYRRDKIHNTKWARGTSAAPGAQCTHSATPVSNPCAECAARPKHRDSDRRCGRNFSHLRHNWTNKESGQAATLARKAFRNEVVEATDGPLANVVSDSSENESARETSPVPEPDAEVMYSYDARSGPSRGTDILSYAITQAVERFEDNETKKLVNKEYDLADDGKETGDGYTADADDDFELIEHAHLK